MNTFKRLKTRWKIMIGMVAFATVFGIGMLIKVVAANDIKLSINMGEEMVFEDMDTPFVAYIGISGKDEAGETSYEKIVYETSNSHIFTVGEFMNEEKSIIQLLPVAAGKAKLNARYIVDVKDGEPVYSKVFSGDATVPLIIDIGSEASIKTTTTADPVTIFMNGSIHNSIKWTYSRPDVVEVKSDPLTCQTATVTGVGAGYTIVTGTTADGLFANFPVYVDPSLTLNEFTVKSGQSIDILPYTNVKNPEAVYWKADKDANGNDVVTINNGILTGISTGEVYIYISCDPSFDEARTVKAKVSVPFDWLDTVSTMNVGNEYQLKTTLNSSSITWSTSNKDVVSLKLTSTGTPDGTVYGVAEGTAVIYATRSYTNLEGAVVSETIQHTINVVDAFGISNNEVTINKGETFTLTALTSNENATISWAVADNKIVDFATVTTKNNITETFRGLKKGDTTIVVTQVSSGVLKTVTCTVHVLEPVGSLTIDPASVMIPVKSSTEVKLFINPLNADNQNIKWASNDPSIATVKGDSLSAVITGVSGGDTTITAISEDGLYIAYCNVSVRLPVEQIKLNVHNVNIDMATEKYQLTYTVYPQAEGVNQDVTWTSSNTSVLTVDEKGLVTFKKPGYATVYCQSTDKTFDYGTGAPFDLCEFYIKKPVTKIELNHTNEKVDVGSELLFTAKITPNDASNPNVIWSSSNTSVATIDSGGYMKAVGSGYAAILCKSESDGITAVCNVYVKQGVKEVVLSKSEISVRKGNDFYLSANILPDNADNKRYSWVSSDTRVATVDDSGHVKTLATGVVTISAIADDNGMIGKCIVTVTEPVDSITLNSSAETLLKDSKFLIIPTVLPLDATDKSVVFKTSDPNVATVDSEGLVTAKKGGNCVITVTTNERGLVASCNITVIEKVSDVSLDTSEMFLNVGATKVFKTSISNSDSATDKRMLWASSDPGVVSVDQYGRITGVGVGSAVVSATAADGGGASASCLVKVVNPVRSISINHSDETLYVGDSIRLSAETYPADATVKSVKWTSSNDNIAYVDQDGEVFAKAPGKVWISATSEDGNEIKAFCTIRVLDNVSATRVAVNAKEIFILAGNGRQLSATIYPRTANEDLLWMSTDTSIANVSSDGYVSTVGVGECEIIAYSSRNAVQTAIPLYSVAISKTKITMEQYDTFQLYVDGSPSKYKVSYRTSNPRVCTISADGLVTARQAGTTTVNATVNGKTMTCTVTVVDIEDEPRVIPYKLDN